MLAKVFREHQNNRNFDKLGRLKLAKGSRQFYPTTLSINFQSNTWNQNDDEQHQTERVEHGSQIDQSTVIAEGDGHHCHQCDTKSDQLLLPKRLCWLRVADFPRAKAN